MRQSSFSRINFSSLGWRIFYITFTFLTALALLWLSFSDFSSLLKNNFSLISKHGLSNFTSSRVDWLHPKTIGNVFSVSLLFCVLLVTVRKLVLFVYKVNLSKLGLKSSYAELEFANQKSILNKNIDELIYMFKTCTIEVLIIEDLDRFNDAYIFTKLRDLCWLLNKSADIEHKITFVYAIRDDLFSSPTRRTKFFDQIIPVIPFMDSSNSDNVISELLKLNQNHYPLSEAFTQLISFFIYDIRTVTNIVNEYLVYKERENRMLQSSINKVSTAEENDIAFAYICIKNLMPEEFDGLHTKKGVLYHIFHEGKNILGKTLEQSDNHDSFNMAYESLKNLIKQYEEEMEEQMAKSGESKKRDSWVQIISANDTVFVSESTEKRLLMLLLKEGYITENYQHFISNFSSSGRSINDYAFLRHVLGNEKGGYKPELPIDDPSFICKKLVADQLKRESALNFTLMEYIMKHQGKNKMDPNTRYIIGNFKYPSDNAIHFLERFLEKIIEKTGNSSLLENEKAFIVYIFNRLSFSSQKHKFKIENLLSTNTKILSLIVKNNLDFLKRKELKLTLDTSNHFASFKLLDKHVLDYLYEADAYTITSEMIEGMVRFKFDYWDEEEIVLNYYNINQLGMTGIQKNIDANINDYYKRVHSNVNAERDPYSLTKLLNKLDPQNEAYLLDRFNPITSKELLSKENVNAEQHDILPLSIISKRNKKVSRYHELDEETNFMSLDFVHALYEENFLIGDYYDLFAIANIFRVCQ